MQNIFIYTAYQYPYESITYSEDVSLSMAKASLRCRSKYSGKKSRSILKVISHEKACNGKLSVITTMYNQDDCIVPTHLSVLIAILVPVESITSQAFRNQPCPNSFDEYVSCIGNRLLLLLYFFHRS